MVCTDSSPASSAGSLLSMYRRKSLVINVESGRACGRQTSVKSISKVKFKMFWNHDITTLPGELQTSSHNALLIS